jgi:type 1 glutamine amidotransferase
VHPESVTSGSEPRARTVRALILSGAGPYADPWHRFSETSERLAELLTGPGYGVEVSEDLPRRLRDLDDVDLLVVNAAGGPSGEVRADVQHALDRYLERGGGLLAMHVGVGTLLDLPGWAEVSGAAWIPGRSAHPPLGPCTVDVRPGAHPISAATASFEVVDERYVHLDLREGSIVIATHEHEGLVHPLVWARTVRASRVVADALGHGVESFDSARHRALLRAAAAWLTEPANHP